MYSLTRITVLLFILWLVSSPVLDQICNSRHAFLLGEAELKSNQRVVVYSHNYHTTITLIDIPWRKEFLIVFLILNCSFILINIKIMNKDLKTCFSKSCLFVLGQKVCFADVKHPCYKMAYFHELSSRVSFQEARLACESEGGVLLSLENEAEQKLIESMLQNLTKPGTGISDGDFWIGLLRSGDGQNSGACPDLYQWSDGSSSQFR